MGPHGRADGPLRQHAEGQCPGRRRRGADHPGPAARPDLRIRRRRPQRAGRHQPGGTELLRPQPVASGGDPGRPRRHAQSGPRLLGQCGRECHGGSRVDGPHRRHRPGRNSRHRRLGADRDRSLRGRGLHREQHPDGRQGWCPGRGPAGCRHDHRAGRQRRGDRCDRRGRLARGGPDGQHLGCGDDRPEPGLQRDRRRHRCPHRRRRPHRGPCRPPACDLDHAGRAAVRDRSEPQQPVGLASGRCGEPRLRRRGHRERQRA